jgi:hypothetical protein
MNHPPIPPKCKYFQSEGGHGFVFQTDRIDVFLDEASPSERSIIAAIAEVEWRKRADRWAILSDEYASKAMYIQGRQFDDIVLRACEFEREHDRCVAVAIAWRQWAVQ